MSSPVTPREEIWRPRASAAMGYAAEPDLHLRAQFSTRRGPHGQFMDDKADNKPFKGMTKESK